MDESDLSDSFPVQYCSGKVAKQSLECGVRRLGSKRACWRKDDKKKPSAANKKSFL